MQTVFIIAIFLIILFLTLQIARSSELLAMLKGYEESRKKNNRLNGLFLLIFLILGMIGVFYCNEKLKGKILGPSASDHGVLVDRMLYVTLALTAIVFFVTQILLFWFSYKYQEKETRKVHFFPHSNKLEFIWTIVPTLSLTILIGFGLVYWARITGEAPKDAMIVEVVGSQFKWEFRYPGKDGVLGKKYYKKIDDLNNNPLGQLWDDPANQDDIYISGEPLHLIVNKPVKMVIGAKDVIHDVGLPHFRMKTDAVPGTPTSMWFTPTKTTKQVRQETNNPNFMYEISCDQMCGKGHWSMRGEIIVESQQEYDSWMATKQPKYKLAMGNIASVDTARAAIKAPTSKGAIN